MSPRSHFGVLQDTVATRRPATNGHSGSSLYSQLDITPLPLVCLDGFSSYVRMKSNCLVSVFIFRNMNVVESYKRHSGSHLENSFC